MSKKTRAKTTCPVPGCTFDKTGRYLTGHVKLKADVAHAAYREQHAGRRPVVATDDAQAVVPPVDVTESVPGSADPFTAQDPEPVVVDDARASEIVVELPPVDEAAPLVPAGSETPPETAPPADDDASGEPVRPVPTVYDLAQQPFFRKGVNRFVRGSLNAWALDPELGDTEVTEQEVDECGIAEFTVETLGWLEREYGWKIPLDHPAVGGLFVAGNLASLVKKHRAPRGPKPKRGRRTPRRTRAPPRQDDDQGADDEVEDVEQGNLETLSPTPPETPRTELGDALDQALGGG